MPVVEGDNRSFRFDRIRHDRRTTLHPFSNWTDEYTLVRIEYLNFLAGFPVQSIPNFLRDNDASSRGEYSSRHGEIYTWKQWLVIHQCVHDTTVPTISLQDPLPIFFARQNLSEACTRVAIVPETGHP